MRVRSVISLLSIVATTVAGSLASGGVIDAAALALRPPTTAPVLDPFRPPDGRYGPGNRGIEYATPAGAPVHAAAEGHVVFAGPVAGSLWVTIDHGGGLRSSYGPLRNLLAASGATVEGGELVAFTAGRLHFGLRLAGTYVDPARWFARQLVRVRLISGPPLSVAQNDDAPLDWAREVSLHDAAGRAVRNIIDTIRAGLRPAAATLPDGPNGSRTMPRRRRRNHFGSCHTRSPRRPARVLNREEGKPWQ